MTVKVSLGKLGNTSLRRLPSEARPAQKTTSISKFAAIGFEAIHPIDAALASIT